MRDDLMDYYYTSVDEMYEGSQGGQDSNGNPSDSMVRNAINSGLGIIHYTGHGDTDVWVTSNFNTGDVNQLTNSAYDPKSGTAEFKAAAIRVEKLVDA